MIEVHIGCVTANITLMGPLFSRLANRLKNSENKRSTRNGGVEVENSSAKHILRDHIGVEHGFQRMEDYNPGMEIGEGIMAPTIGKGEAHSEDGLEMGDLGVHGIVVRKDLEQSYLKPVLH